MSTKKLIWDKTGERKFETGVNKGVLFVQSKLGTYGAGVAWNGLTAVTESPTGAEPNAQYADNIKYLNLMSAEEFGATIEAFTYPVEFEICDGTATPIVGLSIGQQSRSAFGFAYQTRIGNDVQGSDLGYKIHLVYGCTASPSERSYATINDSPEAITFSWEVTTQAVEVAGYKPTATLVIDSTLVPSADLIAVEKILYGDALVESRLPLPSEVFTLLNVVAG